MYPDDLVIKHVRGAKAGTPCLEVAEPFRVVPLEGEPFVVPAGFRFNGRTSPKFLWWLLPPVDETLEAVVHHDYDYETERVPRVTADTLFFQGMGHLQTHPFKKWGSYLYVRALGHFKYGKEHAVIQ